MEFPERINFDDTGFMQRVFAKITEYNDSAYKAEVPVTKVVPPRELKAVFDFPVKDQGITEEEVLDNIDKIFEYSVKANHRHFHNQLYAGVNKFALAGEYITTALNGAMYTYEMAPVFSLME